MATRIIIDKEFKNLIPPLRNEEYINLEESLLSEGCREPITLWNDTIVDGHNRYEICTRLNIPFRIVHKGFSSRAEAVSWICLNQLCRRNISEEAFRYLVGKRYDAEKQLAQRKNAAGINQYSPHHQDNSPSIATPQRRTSAQIGRQYHLNRTTVENYGRLSRSLDKIEKKSPGILPVILSGACKISQGNINAIAELPEEDIHEISEQLHARIASRSHVTLKESSKAILTFKEAEKKETHPVLMTGIKTMPAYDPDSKLKEMLLTIPSWKNELDKLNEKDSFSVFSIEIMHKFFKVLCELQSSISSLQMTIKEYDHGKRTD